MAVQENGSATRATTSCASDAQRCGESALFIHKCGKPQTFYTFMLTIGTRSRCDPVDVIPEDEKMVTQVYIGTIVVNML